MPNTPEFSHSTENDNQPFKLEHDGEHHVRVTFPNTKMVARFSLEPYGGSKEKLMERLTEMFAPKSNSLFH